MFRNPTTDLIVVLVIVLLIFGPKRLPGLGRSLGDGLREFKDSITGDSKDEDEPDRPELPRAGTTPLAGSGEPTSSAPSESATVPAAGSSEVPAERRS
ncbi:MAG: sec-independent protein translocase protein TatA [Solirubrobacteraceae bacterium]|jgi:sec-independent protein translocase protein TatA|nr:sec-independent protein translocase protein TatA [Solirubrobacteraceae bacterium]